MQALKGFVLIVILLLAACRPRPQYDYRTSDRLLHETFDSPFTWEHYQAPGIDQQVKDGAYHMRLYSLQGRYAWGLGAQIYDNTVIEVRTAQLTAETNNAYGVMCRADSNNNGKGYYFMISGDGYWSIRRGDADAINPLRAYEKTDAINLGQAINTIKAICIDDYLALYVNDIFIGDATDSKYTHGHAGFAVAVAPDDTAEITFDNLIISGASLLK